MLSICGICEYKKSEHTLVYTWFDNSEKAPYSRAHHITDLPDSIDIVSLMYPDNLATWELEDMESVRENKATKVIYSIDFESSFLASVINSCSVCGQAFPSSKNSWGVTPRYSQM